MKHHATTTLTLTVDLGAHACELPKRGNAALAEYAIRGFDNGDEYAAHVAGLVPDRAVTEREVALLHKAESVEREHPVVDVRGLGSVHHATE